MGILSAFRELICTAIGHSFDDWRYTSSGSCWQLRTCMRDVYQEKREFHALGEWKDDLARPCWQVRTCSRDGYQELRQVHSFGEWQYEAPDSCWLVRTCVNDGFRERKESPHQFSGWVQEECITDVYEHGAQGQERMTWDERRCHRCGYIETENTRYWWR